MPLSQPTNVKPSLTGALGDGCIDATENLVVSWQVNGQSPMTAYRIVIYENNETSSQVLSTGRVYLKSPFYGKDANGNSQTFSATIAASSMSAAGLVNGREYKIVITQWWNGSDAVTQTSASAFITRKRPTLSIDTIPSPLAVRSYTFTANYSQQQGDNLNWVRWYIASADDLGNPLYDSQNIYGTQLLSMTYDGFFPGTSSSTPNYAVRCVIQTENGIEIDTGWVLFTVYYQVQTATGQVNLSCADGGNGVLVSWTTTQTNNGFSVYRLLSETGEFVHVCDTEARVNSVLDYGAKSNVGNYRWYIYERGVSELATSPLLSDNLPILSSAFCIIEAQKDASQRNLYRALKTFCFRSNIAMADISNNNAPTVSKNFTRFPTVFSAPQNYKSGALSGLIGIVKRDDTTGKYGYYNDTAQARDELFELSSSSNTLFLKTPKGELMQIRISGDISTSVDYAHIQMPQNIKIPWIEIGYANGLSIVR